MTAFAITHDSVDSGLRSATPRARWKSSASTIGLLAVVSASIVSSLSYTARADRDVNRQYSAKLATYRQQAGRISQFERLRSQAVAFATQAALDSSLIDAVPASRALAEVDNALLPGVRLVGINLDSEAQAQAPLAPAKTLEIKGVAPNQSDIAQFVARLSKSPLLQAIHLIPAAANSANKSAPQNFEVQASFGSGANVLQANALP
jgi:Tfp pilus assembly protein PilN